MKLLLDTHLLVWLSLGTLPRAVIPYIADADNTLLFSLVSIWEAVIKKGLGRANFQVDPYVLYNGLLENGFAELAIASRHVLAVADLPPIHKDPFDRLLIAQARAEGITLLTADATIARYGDGIIHIHR